MNRIMLISHSRMLAEATIDFCKRMLPKNKSVTMDYVAGNDEDGFGNSFLKIKSKLEAEKFTNTFFIYDLGSAKMMLDLALKDVGGNNYILKCPFVEGAFVAFSLINNDVDPQEVISQIEDQTISKKA